MKFLFIAFVVIPIVEIYFLISVGSAIGAGWTIGLILFTAFLGAILVRAQGFSTFIKVQEMLAKGEMPAIEILEGVFLLVAGALLLTPGFVTDAIGFACLTPPLRRWIIKKILAAGVLHGRVHSIHGKSNVYSQSANNQGRVIDAEYRDLDD